MICYLWWPVFVSDGSLGTEALQLCLPHQLDLRTGQLWADDRSMLQLHQQRLTPEVDGFLTTSVVLPPDSEIVAPFSVSGVRPNCCALVEPSRTLTEEYGVIVGHTLVDASSRSASVLMVKPNAEEVVLPSFTCVGKLVPVSAISVALAVRACRTRSMLLCQSIWRKSSQEYTLRWGTLVANCFVTSFIAIDMFFRHQENQ